MQLINLQEVRASIDAFDQGHQELKKAAFVPGAAAPPPQGDPNAMPPGGAPPQGPPPGDPNAMPPQGPPPQGDPNAMPPQDPNAMPPQGGDPNAMPPQDPNAMPPGGAPPQGGGMGQEAEAAMSDMAEGMNQMSQVVEGQQRITSNLASRMLNIEQRLDEKDQEDKLKQPAPLEGSTRGGGEAPQLV